MSTKPNSKAGVSETLTPESVGLTKEQFDRALAILAKTRGGVIGPALLDANYRSEDDPEPCTKEEQAEKLRAAHQLRRDMIANVSRR